MEKACTKCGETKPVEAFHRNAKTGDGLSHRCTLCTKPRPGAPKRVRVEAAPEKSCSKCHTVKPIADFGKRNTGLDGHNTWCKSCCRANNRESYWRHPDRRRAAAKVFRLNNPGHSTPFVRAWAAKNPEKKKFYCEEFWRKNPGMRAKYAMDRVVAIKQQTIRLSAEHHSQIAAIYAASAMLTDATGIAHNVDHIIPLQGRLVRGLHVPWNLQIITAEVNRKKSNKVVL
jgi:hypothetical protein